MLPAKIEKQREAIKDHFVVSWRGQVVHLLLECDAESRRQRANPGEATSILAAWRASEEGAITRLPGKAAFRPGAGLLLRCAGHIHLFRSFSIATKPTLSVQHFGAWHGIITWKVDLRAW
jgi:hypothetical protein